MSSEIIGDDTIRPEYCGVCEVGDGEDGEVDDGGVETRSTRRIHDPGEPSEEERLEHQKTHLPYRSWCLDCAMGRGLPNPHITKKEAGTMPEVIMDFCFLGQEGEPGNTLPVLVAKEERTKM